MDAKDLRTQPTLCSDRYNESNKYSEGADSLQCDRTKSYQELGSSSLAKVDIPSVRPCAVIGPDRVVPPPASTDAYLKKTTEPWPTANDTYRRPPDYPHKLPSYLTPTRNISPRQTFQENMQRIMVPLPYNSTKLGDDNYAQIPDRNSAQPKNVKLNVPSEAKYCDVPYNVNPNGVEQKNVRNTELCASSGSLSVPRNAPPGWPPTGGNLRPRPYPGPDLYPYQEYPSCAGPRPVLTRSHRTAPEEGYIFPDAYYQDGTTRFKPYPTVKDRYPPRYEYIANYTNPFHPPPPFPTHRYDLQKTVPPHFPPYPPVKYVDNRVVDPVMEGYHRNQPGHFGMPYRSPVVHPGYPQALGNGPPQNKMHPYNHDSSVKQIASNKLIYDQNTKNYLEYENSRHKIYPDGYFVNELGRLQPMKNQVMMPNYPGVNMHQVPSNPYYKKENAQIKHLEYMSHMKNLDPNLNIHNIMSRHPMFSPNTLTMSPTDSNASNDTILTLGNTQEDCGYVSQSSTTSIRSMDSGANRGLSDYYRRYYDPRPMHLAKTSSLLEKTDMNTNNASKDKKQINVRQFLQMWSEGDDEAVENKEVKMGENNNFNKTQGAHSQEQLYVLGYVNVSQDELDKYEHIQKVSKLPENIKGYSNIDLLNQFEEVIESTNANNFKTSTFKDDFQTHAKPVGTKQPSFLPRPVSPLDVEAKISQSIIHKEVGCNFEIRPCSPKMLNVDVAAPVQNILAERTIEKVTNPGMLKSPNMHGVCDSMNYNIIPRTNSRPNNDNLRNTSCKMINSPFSNNSSDDTIKNTYSFQDLESNSGLCLASLPRLDNDIELNFPEVNQQFINANRVEPSVITTPKDLPLLDEDKMKKKTKESKELGQDIKISETPSESEKEFTKLSKYRKIKTNALSGSLSPGIDKSAISKEVENHTNSHVIRTDSVIIKNPENTKYCENMSIHLMNESDNTLPINLTSNSTSADKPCYQIEMNTMRNETSTDIAIDFSLNKQDSSNVFSVLEESESKIPETIFRENLPKIQEIDDDKYNIESNIKDGPSNYTHNPETINRKQYETEENIDIIHEKNDINKLNGKPSDLMLPHEIKELDDVNSEVAEDLNPNTNSKFLDDPPQMIAQNQLLLKMDDENHDTALKNRADTKENMECAQNVNFQNKSDPASIDTNNRPVSKLLHEPILPYLTETIYKKEVITSEELKITSTEQNHSHENQSLESAILSETYEEHTENNENVMDNIESIRNLDNSNQDLRNDANEVVCSSLVLDIDKNVTSKTIICTEENEIGLNKIKSSEIYEDTTEINESDITINQIHVTDANVDETIIHKMADICENDSLGDEGQDITFKCESNNMNDFNPSILLEPILGDDLDEGKNILKNGSTPHNDTDYAIKSSTDNVKEPLMCTEHTDNIYISGHPNNTIINATNNDELKYNNATCCIHQLQKWRKRIFSPYIQNLMMYNEGTTSEIIYIKNSDIETVDLPCSISCNVTPSILQTCQHDNSTDRDSDNNVTELMKDSSNNNELDNPAFAFGPDCISPIETENMKESCTINTSSMFEDPYKTDDSNSPENTCESLPVEAENINEKLEDLVNINASTPIRSNDFISPIAKATDFSFKYPSDGNTESAERQLNSNEISNFDDKTKLENSILVLNSAQNNGRKNAELKFNNTENKSDSGTTLDIETNCDSCGIEIKSSDEMGPSKDNECYKNMTVNEKSAPTQYHTHSIIDNVKPPPAKEIVKPGHDDLNTNMSKGDYYLEDNSEISSTVHERGVDFRSTLSVEYNQETNSPPNDENQSQTDDVVTKSKEFNEKLCVAKEILPILDNETNSSETKHINIADTTETLKSAREVSLAEAEYVSKTLASGFSRDSDEKNDAIIERCSTMIDDNTSIIHDNAAIEAITMDDDYLLDSNKILCSEAAVSQDALNSVSVDDPDNESVLIDTTDIITQESHTAFESFNNSISKTKLKRSLSDSALNHSNFTDDFKRVNEQNVPYIWPSKRRKLNIESLEDELINQNLCNIIQNRRNSISSVYHEENVSFCLIIDDACIISEESDDSKMCYTELSQDCLSEIQDEIVSENNIDNNIEELATSATNSLAIDSCEYSDAFSFNCGDKALEDSWVEDIACVETVISDDIAEDIVISGPSSPKEENSSDNDESGVFDCSEHTDKVKYIYGGKLCSDDAQYVDTLFNTPQMNVTKRLTQRETQDYKEYETLKDKLYYDRDSLEKLLSESNATEPSFTSDYCNTIDMPYNTPKDKKIALTEEFSKMNDAIIESICAKSSIDAIDDQGESKVKKLNDETQDDTVHSCESSIDNVFSYKLEHKDEVRVHRTSSSPEVSSTTSEEKSSTILLKITNYGGSRISQINSVNSIQDRPSCKFTEEKDYIQSLPGHSTKRPLLTKAAQKYIPPLKETIRDLKVKLSLPQHSLLKLKQLKKSQNDLKKVVKNVSKVPVKPKPKFEDVLKSIDEIQFKKHKESKKVKKSIPKVVIKKNENGSHYASTSRRNEYNPDLTGRKWQPWVFLEKDSFIDKMAIKNKNKAIFNYRKNTYVLAEKFKKYKSIHNTKFVITQPKSENSHRGLKYTIRLKHIY